MQSNIDNTFQFTSGYVPTMRHEWKNKVDILKQLFYELFGAKVIRIDWNPVIPKENQDQQADQTADKQIIPFIVTQIPKGTKFLSAFIHFDPSTTNSLSHIFQHKDDNFHHKIRIPHSNEFWMLFNNLSPIPFSHLNSHQIAHHSQLLSLQVQTLLSTVQKLQNQLSLLSSQLQIQQTRSQKAFDYYNKRQLDKHTDDQDTDEQDLQHLFQIHNALDKFDDNGV